jgi:hypothetical protein
MKSLLLATTMLAALMTSAHAAQLPETMLGNWCFVQDPSRLDAITVYERGTDERVKNDSECIKISRNEWHSLEDGCKFGRIMRWGGTYIVYMHCWEAGEERKQPLSTAILVIDDNGKLEISQISPRYAG